MCFPKDHRYRLERLTFHQEPPLRPRAPSFSPRVEVARWSVQFYTRDQRRKVERLIFHQRPPLQAGTTKAPPKFAVAPTSLPYGDKAFVVSTPPASLGPHPPANLACLVPSTTGYTPSCLASCGVSVTLRTPYWERDRGYRHTQVMTTGIRVSSDSSFCACNNRAKPGRPETPQFLWVILNRPFWTSWTFWTSFGQCPKCPK